MRLIPEEEFRLREKEDGWRFLIFWNSGERPPYKFKTPVDDKISEK